MPKPKIPQPEVLAWLESNHPDLAPKAELDRDWVWLAVDLRSECQRQRKRDCACEACRAAIAKREALSDYGFRFAGRGHPLPSGAIGTWGHSCTHPIRYKGIGRGAAPPGRPTTSEPDKPNRKPEREQPAYTEADALAFSFASGQM